MTVAGLKRNLLPETVAEPLLILSSRSHESGEKPASSTTLGCIQTQTPSPVNVLSWFASNQENHFAAQDSSGE
jgi:hypothetical protein